MMDKGSGVEELTHAQLAPLRDPEASLRCVIVLVAQRSAATTPSALHLRSLTRAQCAY
jgi:hypothetical protein